MNTFACICGRSFPTRHRLDGHIGGKHRGALGKSHGYPPTYPRRRTPYWCACGKRYASRRALEDHVKQNDNLYHKTARFWPNQGNADDEEDEQSVGGDTVTQESQTKADTPALGLATRRDQLKEKLAALTDQIDSAVTAILRTINDAEFFVTTARKDMTWAEQADLPYETTMRYDVTVVYRYAGQDHD